MSIQGMRESLGAQLFELVPDPIFLLTPEGVFLDVNRSAARYLGAEAESVVGRSVREIFPPEQAQRQLDVIRQVVESGEPFSEERVTTLGDKDFIFQYALRRVDDGCGNIIGIVGMVRDVTSLVQLQHQYQELYEQATDALFALDPDGHLKALNREAEALSGYARDELETLHFSQLVPPEEAERLQGYFEKRVEGEDAPTQYETQYLHGSGEERWAEVKISRRPSGPGVFQASVRDVTPRKRLEDLRQEFLRMVGHEVKTPLTVIQGFANAMSSGFYGDTSPQQDECLERIVGASRRVRHLIEQFLLAERVDAAQDWGGYPGPLAITLTNCVENLRGEADSKGVALNLRVDGSQGLVAPDARGLQYVLDNLLSNALKFTPSGGAIRVRCEAGADTARIEVEDSGVGIPEAERTRIFERFFRASTSGGTEGSGLGLYIARGIVEQLGGTIRVESRPDSGTCFTVCVPVAKP